jgi:LysR family transcriptional activator of nhaA
MSALNYKHLRYFWMVAKSGSIARACEQLHLTPQAVSGQLRELEEALGVELLRRAGRGLELTEAGRRILSYADEIFSLGDELLDVARDQTTRKILPFAVGIADSVPKSVAHRLVAPALHLPEAVRLICREGRLNALLADLAVHRLDMVIADRPMPTNLNVRGYSHLLGDSDLSVFAAPELAETLGGSFPDLLQGAPFLLPGDDVAIRARLEQWFEARHLYPRIVGEFDDSALLKSFGQAGAGAVRRTNGDCRLRHGSVSRRCRWTHRIDQRTALRHHHRASLEPPGHRRHHPGCPQRGIPHLDAHRR